MTVYPRACGGTGAAIATVAAAMGLSPRVRGNPVDTRGATARSRSIPARAGEPPRAASAPGRGAVYPRACGGTRPDDRHPKMGHGLSPRVRGNRVPGSGLRQGSRSIPARAGEPFIWSQYCDVGRVYPRACGGTATKPARAPRPYGLSPRVRGNRRGRAPDRCR